jgi:photosystem II stability/assembly factor-like uncharacterized protein
MKKFIILILSLSFLAASCDLGSVFSFGGGTKGIFKSEDAGETFNTADKVSPRGDLSSLVVNTLAFDTSSADTLYLGASNGIFKSTDAAKTWKYVLSNIAVADIAVDPFQANVVYASGIAGSRGKIIKSLDGGVTWVDIYTEPSSNNTVLSIAVSATNNQVVLAGLNSGEIIRSFDGGHAWQAVKDFSKKILSVQFGPSGTAYALNTLTGLSKSTDLGVTWTPLTDNLVNDVYSPQNNTVTSVNEFDNMALDRKQAGVLYLGTDRGVLRSVNDGNSWSSLPLPVKKASLPVTALTVDPSNSNNLMASIGSTLFKSINGGVTWQTRVLPTQAWIQLIEINPQSQNLIYLGMKSSP